MAKKNYDSPVQATLTGIKDLFKSKKPDVHLNPDDRLDGKKVLITGASSGLGFATSIELARLGATVIMGCRSGIPEKGGEVRKRSGSQDVHMVSVDLSDMERIKSFVDDVKSKFGKIDILICNAAVVASGSRKTRQGLDEMFMVNYVAKYLLIRLLFMNDCFVRDGGSLPRIVFVSSESHRNPPGIDWDGFGKFREFKMGETVKYYGYYKLLMTTFAVELSRRLNPGKKAETSVFALCPGPVNSNIAREAPAIFKPLMKLVFALFFRTPEKASAPVVYMAASRDQEGKKLDYLFLMNKKEIDEKALDADSGKRLWEETERLLERHGVVFQQAVDS
jgi:NAD(P)-dependent dehydrogenase (short-subunit alcohol dehydrogenase family)